MKRIWRAVSQRFHIANHHIYTEDGTSCIGYEKAVRAVFVVEDGCEKGRCIEVLWTPKQAIEHANEIRRAAAEAAAINLRNN